MRPFPVDLYYGDVARSAEWTDEGTWHTSGGERGVDNNSYDGYFDPQVSNSLQFPSAIEIPVSRIDFARLPILTETPPPGVPVVSEAELLRRYLTKDHRYRMNKLAFGDMLACFTEPEMGLLGDPTWMSLRNGASWPGKLDVTTKYLDIFHDTAGQTSQW